MGLVVILLMSCYVMDQKEEQLVKKTPTQFHVHVQGAFLAHKI